MTAVTNMHGGGLHAHNATDSTDRAVDDGGSEDHGTVDRANRAADTCADCTADNIADRAGHAAAANGAVMGTTDNALSVGGERDCKRREKRNGGGFKSG